MPPRKSNVSAISTNEDGGTPTKEPRDGVNVEDLSLPKTMVQRLAKGVLPPNTQIQKDSILAMQKGATVFVNYLAQAANATAQTNNRRTIPPTAIFDALQELEFEAFSQRVQAELTKFNETQTGKRNEYRRKLKEDAKAKQEGGESANGVKGERESEVDGDGERSAKRARMGDDDDEEGGVAVNGHGANGHADERGMANGDGEDDEVIVVDDNEDDGVGDRNEGEENAEEEDEEEDDEDEYPDEGRRLSSLEPDAYTDGEARHRAETGDEAMSDDGSE